MPDVNDIVAEVLRDDEYVLGTFGDTGPQGEKGDAATIRIGTVTTGTPQTPASVTNSGTQYDAVLNFVIPKGDTGSVDSTTDPLKINTVRCASLTDYTNGNEVAAFTANSNTFGNTSSAIKLIGSSIQVSNDDTNYYDVLNSNTGANNNLSNLTTTGEEHFDNKFAFKNLSNVPSTILHDRIVASGFDGFGSYFFQYASGAIRQGGIIDITTSWQTINLFREMPNTNYIITTGAIISDGDNPSVFIRSTNKTTTSFQASFKWDTGQYKSGTLMWEAFTMGYTQGEE